MRIQTPYVVELQYRDAFDETKPSEAELALIRSVLSEILVELVNTTSE